MKTKMKEVMTEGVETVPPSCTLQEAAQRMKNLNVGALPICDGEKLVGMVTDRDIAIRAVAQALDPRRTRVEEVMSSPAIYCTDDQDIGDAVLLMESKQIRRLPVIDRNSKLVGIVSLGDLAVKTDRNELKAEALEKISEPVKGQAA